MWAFLLFLLRFPFVAFYPTDVSLEVPYVSQVPDGQWVLPWSQACEEASIAMVGGYYRREVEIPNENAKTRMQRMIDWEDGAFKKNEDTDAEETAKLIASQGGFRATVVREPSLDDIKKEVAARRPVIALVDMYALYQEPSQGDSFHVLVITGYDDGTKEFIVKDPARTRERYSYDVVMSSLHDLSPTTHEADAEATVLYTRPSLFGRFSDFWSSLFAPT